MGEEFKDMLLYYALEHYEKYFVNGEHEFDCPLCHLLIDVAASLRVPIADLKLLEMKASSDLVCGER